MKTLSLLMLASVSFLVSNGAFGQGLKGVPQVHCFRSASQPPPLMDGKSNKERWAKFVAIQPSLIGMDFRSVEKALGDGKSDEKHSFLAYTITETDGPHHKGDLASVECSISFDKGIVESYLVNAVHWGN